MKWIKASEQLPIAGKEVVCLIGWAAGWKGYEIGYYCCRDKWVIRDLGVKEVIMWAELPPIEPE